MKKFTFVLAALIVATFANAEITLNYTSDGFEEGRPTLEILTNGGPETPSIVAPYFYYYYETGFYYENDTLKLYNPATFALYKTIALPGKFNEKIYYISRNIFTLDGKVAFIYDGKIIDEDNNVIYDFSTDYETPELHISFCQLVKINGAYKLIVNISDNYGGSKGEYIYTLPGNGDTSTEINYPSSPKRVAHKIVREGQVLVKTETRTYDLRGQEVK